jgi:hypothetical protein
VRERPNRAVSKTAVAQVTVGSNPTPSARRTNAPTAPAGAFVVVGQALAGRVLRAQEANMATTDRSTNEPSVAQSVRPEATQAGMIDAYTPSTACEASVGSSVR